MSESFNGYHVWLGIPLSEQPPNHYRLLGISVFESDQDVIDHAADRQMAHVRTFQAGRHAALSQQILNELAAARVCLLSPEKKANYDETLRAKLAAAPVIAAVPVGKAVPVAQPLMPPTARPAAAPVAPLASGTGRPAAPVGATPVSAAAAPAKSAPTKPANATSVPATSAKPAAADDEDPFGLRAAAGRRPVAAKGGSLFDEEEVGEGSPRIAIDLSRRSTNTDILVQKLAIYGFAAVAGLVLLMVAWNMVTRNFGPPREWFKAPVVAEPVHEEPKHAAPPAPLPPAASAPAAEGTAIENGG